MTITRPALRYLGGKWRIAPWIIEHMPVHAYYVEPYGGAGSVLLRKPKCKVEIYNDLNDELVNFFQVMRNPVSAENLLRELRLTPFSRTEFDRAHEHAGNPVERARRLVIRCFQGHGAVGFNIDNHTGWRCGKNQPNRTPAQDWAGLADSHKAIIDRLHGVSIECRPAADIIEKHDSPQTFFYLDPPYVHDTRTAARSGKWYAYEMSDAEHMALLAQILELEGMVLISGYRCDLYDTMLAGWRRVDRASKADGGRDRTESLWLNPAADTRDLFSIEKENIHG